jgi:hypothetical protein
VRPERAQAAAPKLTPLTTTSVAGERRAAAAPEIVCYLAPGGALVRAQRLTDSTVARLAAGGAANARTDVPPLRVNGDTAFLATGEFAFRVSCPATP